MAQPKRYPGVRPFETADKDMFFGRKRDIADLTDLIVIEPLVVLFGKSGYGKSSLLNAGIIPQLEEIEQEEGDQLIPVQVRLGSYVRTNPTPVENVIARLSEKAKPADQMQFMDSLATESTLWYQFKRRMASTEDRYLVIFDQFEEFFTYPPDQQVAFKTQIAALLNPNAPQDIRTAALNLSKDQRRLLATPLNIKVIFAIRADRMSLLDSMKDKLPAILQSRYELKGLTPNQAREAIVEPARMKGDFESPAFVYTEEALLQMTDRLSETLSSQQKGIESFQLQILCEYLEDQVIRKAIPDLRIEPYHFADHFQEIFEGYYQRQIEKLDSRVQYAAQRLIEDKLIFHDERSGEARRLSVDTGVLLSEAGIDQELLNQLESAFLLRREASSTGGFNYEVSHDTLIAPIIKLKGIRQAREQAEQERDEARRKQRRLMTVLVGVVAALVVVIGVVVYVLNLSREANVQRDQAQKALQDFKQQLAENNAMKARARLEDARKCRDAGFMNAACENLAEAITLDSSTQMKDTVTSLRKIYHCQ